jgi:TATA-box binding protein (TBP) (component of TFIID and TFIIIB)
MLEEAWDEFMKSGDITVTNTRIDDIDEKLITLNNEIPNPSELYISTKTKIIFLNSNVELGELFWKIPIISYNTKGNGIIKKQMKFISNTKDELSNLQDKLTKYSYYKQHIIKHVEQQQSNDIFYKDVRKISIGISNKDILNERSKTKSAFYNCFVIIVRLLFNNIFKEVHVKIFNTGQIEIPGIQNDILFDNVLKYIKELLNNLYNPSIDYLQNKTSTVLINSNFNCGYCINRTKLFDILKNKHNLNVSFDPCSYPGIQCKYKVNDNVGVSFMIFRTGSILIVGKCNESIIRNVYEFIKDILYKEYENINEKYKISQKNKKDIKIRNKIKILNL